MLYFYYEKKSTGKLGAVVKKSPTSNEPRDADSSEFNTFQFWRNPLPSIETDLLELLVRKRIHSHGCQNKEVCLADCSFSVGGRQGHGERWIWRCHKEAALC